MPIKTEAPELEDRSGSIREKNKKNDMDVRFYSSTEGAAFLERFRVELESLGYSVKMVSAVRSGTFRSWKNGLISGCAIRVWMNLSIGVKLLWGLLMEPKVIHIITTNPFFLPFFASFFNQRKTIMLLFDLYPDVLQVSGVIRRDGMVARGLALCTARGIAKCSGTVFLGERLKIFTEEKYGYAPKSAVIPVGADGSLFPRFKELMETPKENVRILYSGNLGRMHEVRTLKEGIAQALRDGCGQTGSVQFLFHASGNGYSQLMVGLNKVKDKDSVILKGPIGDNQKWAEVMASADVSLVSLAQGAENLVMPSKVYSSLVAGHAVIAVCNVESELADLVREYDCGWLIAPGDVNGFANRIESIAANPEELLAKRRNAYRAGHEYFDMGAIAGRWNELFRELDWHQ